MPWLIYSQVKTFSNETHILTQCFTAFPSIEFQRFFFFVVMFGCCYLLPLTFMSVCYLLLGFKIWRQKLSGSHVSQANRNMQRRKTRIVRMLITVAAVFALFWLPLYVIKFIAFFAPQYTFVSILTPIAQLLGSATSAVNPFIYCYFSIQFRLYVAEILPCIFNQANTEANNGSPCNKTKVTEFLLEKKP